MKIFNIFTKNGIIFKFSKLASQYHLARYLEANKQYILDLQTLDWHSQKWLKIVIHKSTFFLKTPSSIWAKMAQMMLRDPLKMSYKSGLTQPSKIFHGPKNEVLGPF